MAEAEVGGQRLAAPTGDAQTIAFMLTDVEGSTRLWERDSTSMAAAMARLDEIIAETAAAHGGHTVRERGEGDSSFNVFTSPNRAAAAAVALQRALAGERWPEPTPIRVRLAVHVGEAQFRDGDYYGSAVNRCARLRALAHGGQAVISAGARALVADNLPEGVSLLDLGSHRLKDLAEPERIYQLCHPQLAHDFPPLNGLERIPNNLPIQLTSFVGRESDVAGLADLLRHERLVTLTGAGGCGKTRLALQVAAAVSEHFSDGTWFVDLSGVTDPELVPDAVGGAMGLRDRTALGAADASVAEAVLHEVADHAALLVIDNCEHLVTAAAEFVSSLLGRAPGVAVVATSREVLGIPGESTWHVRSLSVPDLRQQSSLELLQSNEAVRLFVDRASRHQRGFGINQENLGAVAEICARVDGIPLAIELAAARVRVMTPRQIADRLNDQFRLLTGSSRTVPSRQATLRATVDWGHELLDRPEQALFRRLAVFSGGWTLEAAEAICGPWTDLDAVDGMTRLVDKSMVVREGDGNASRFRLLEPLRQYALEKLVSSEEVEDVRNRHLSWFANWAAESGDALLGRGQVEGLGLIDADLDNIRSALEWGVPAHRVEALELAASLGLYWQYRRLLKEGLSWLMLALDAAEASPGLRVRSLTTAGRLALGLHQHAQASQLITRGLQLAQDHELRAGAAEATWRLAQVAVAERDHQAAAARFAEAVAMAREVGDARLLSVALIDSAEHAFYLGEAPDEWIKEALGLARRAGDVRNASVALRILGEIQMANGVLDAALTSLREAVDLGRSIRGKGTVVDGLIELGRVLHASGQDGEARAAVTEALVLSNESDYGWGIAAATELAAQLLATAGDPRVARVLLAGASTLRQQIGAPRLPREALRLEAASAAMEAFIAPELVRHVEAGEPLDGVGLVALALSALAMNVS